MRNKKGKTIGGHRRITSILNPNHQRNRNSKDEQEPVIKESYKKDQENFPEVTFRPYLWVSQASFTHAFSLIIYLYE